MSMRLLHLISSSAVLFAVLFVGAAGGVVGGATVTGADGVVAAPESDKSARGERQSVDAEHSPPAAVRGRRVNCPEGKRATGGSAFWEASQVAVPLIIDSGLTGATAVSDGVTTADTLTVRLICATLG